MMMTLPYLKNMLIKKRNMNLPIPISVINDDIEDDDYSNYVENDYEFVSSPNIQEYDEI